MLARKEPVLVLGEVLWDVFPDQRRLGGAPFNFAFHLHNLGVPVRFVSRIGDDGPGREILAVMEDYGLSTEGIQIDSDHATGEVRVSLNRDNSHSFEILSPRAFDFISPESTLKRFIKRTPSLVYFGSLAQRNEVSRVTIQAVLQQCRTSSILFSDLNLRAPFFDAGMVRSILNSADFLKCNDEELQILRQLLALTVSLKEVPDYLMATFRIGNLCVTLGERGSLWFRPGQDGPRFVASGQTSDFRDSVGAGDAFAAMIAAGFLFGWPLQAISERAAIFSAEICSLRGALPENPGFYERFRLK